MRRFIIAVGLAAAMVLMVRELAGKMAPTMRARCAEACERMLAKMPDSFPPNRMMADLEVLMERTARILDLVDRPTDDQSGGSPSLREHPISAPRP